MAFASPSTVKALHRANLATTCCRETRAKRIGLRPVGRGGEDWYEGAMSGSQSWLRTDMPCGGLGETQTNSKGQNAKMFRPCGRKNPRFFADFAAKKRRLRRSRFGVRWQSPAHAGTPLWIERLGRFAGLRPSEAKAPSPSRTCGTLPAHSTGRILRQHVFAKRARSG